MTQLKTEDERSEEFLFYQKKKEILKVLIVLENVFRDIDLFNEQFHCLVDVIELVWDVRNVSLLNQVNNPKVQKYVQTYNIHNVDNYKIEEKSSQIHIGLVGVVNAMLNYKNIIEGLITDNLTSQKSDDVFTICYEGKIKMTFLLYKKEKKVRLLSIHNKETKQTRHYRKKWYFMIDDILHHLNHIEEYVNYDDDVLEMVEY